MNPYELAKEPKAIHAIAEKHLAAVKSRSGIPSDFDDHQGCTVSIAGNGSNEMRRWENGSTAETAKSTGPKPAERQLEQTDGRSSRVPTESRAAWGKDMRVGKAVRHDNRLVAEYVRAPFVCVEAVLWVTPDRHLPMCPTIFTRAAPKRGIQS